MHLQHAERDRLVEHACPCSHVKLLLPRLKRKRIGAIGTTERAAVSEFGQEAERP
jgi:hypothetical protein